MCKLPCSTTHRQSLLAECSPAQIQRELRAGAPQRVTRTWPRLNSKPATAAPCAREPNVTMRTTGQPDRLRTCTLTCQVQISEGEPLGASPQSTHCGQHVLGAQSDAPRPPLPASPHPVATCHAQAHRFSMPSQLPLSTLCPRTLRASRNPPIPMLPTGLGGLPPR